MKPKPLKAAIFDVDGTLIDSVDFHARAWVEAFAEFGLTVPFEKVRRQIGKGGDNLMPVFLSSKQMQMFGQELDTFRSGHFKRKYLDYLRPFAGVRPLFERLIADGVRIGLPWHHRQSQTNCRSIRRLPKSTICSMPKHHPKMPRCRNPHPTFFMPLLGNFRGSRRTELS
jgi:beta-phosphoglucomutase-like phosphatase (HAD superfamily)